MRDNHGTNAAGQMLRQSSSPPENGAAHSTAAGVYLRAVLNIPDGVRRHGRPVGCMTLITKPAPAVVLAVVLP